jgi:TonB family protein
MREKQDGPNQQKEEQTGGVRDQVDTSAFERDLRVTLDWLAEGSASDPGFGDCPETESVVSHARGEHQPGLSEHVKGCQRCEELVSYLRQRDHVYQRQREYFLKQVESEHKDEPWLSSVGEVLGQTFRPFEFLLQKRALVAVSVVLVAATIGVWRLPTFVATYRASPGGVSFDARNLLASRKVEADYGRIQQSNAADPEAAEKILGELRDATRKGGMVTPEKMDAVLASVQAKKTEAPEKSGDWDRIENQLQVFALLNRYGQLRSEKQTGAPLWKDFIGGSEEDGNALIFLNRELSYDPETYKLLEESRLGTKGVTGVTLVTPSNKRVPVTGYLPSGFEKQVQPAEPQSLRAAVSVASKSEHKPASAKLEGAGYDDQPRHLVASAPSAPGVKASDSGTLGVTGSEDTKKSAEYGARMVNILDKPRPRYTEEARALKLEGDVVLDVVFLANGKVEVKRVISGLGHGLDERAAEAAQAIKFEPAQAAGKPVDFPARLRIEFRIPD